MTDAVLVGTEWVPRFGMLEVRRERAELIRGLFELAAWVADHPELPLPIVSGRVYTGDGDWQSKCRVVDQVAEALEEVAVEDDGRYTVQKAFGPIEFYSTAITCQEMAAFHAHMSYAANVQPEAQPKRMAGGAR
jgi:hypothetical protein